MQQQQQQQPQRCKRQQCSLAAKMGTAAQEIQQIQQSQRPQEQVQTQRHYHYRTTGSTCPRSCPTRRVQDRAEHAAEPDPEEGDARDALGARTSRFASSRTAESSGPQVLQEFLATWASTHSRCSSKDDMSTRALRTYFAPSRSSSSVTTRRKACHAMRRLEQDGARRLVSSPPPGPILAPSRVHLHHAARGISAAPLITRSARRSWRRARTSCRPSAAVQCCHGCPRRVCPPALAVDNKSARSLSRHALPRQGAAAPRRWPMHLQAAEEGRVCRVTWPLR